MAGVMSSHVFCLNRQPAQTIMTFIRCTVFHISSYAWSNAYTELCERWVQFLAACISHQVDFLQGDGNLFAQRNFKQDDRSDFRSCIILVDLLERFLGQINMHRSALNRITFNIVSSTQAGELILLNICYGKQAIVCEGRQN